MQESKTVTITHKRGDMTFRVQHMNPTKANKMLVRLIKVVGQPVVTLLLNRKAEASQVMGAAVDMMRMSLDEAEMDRLLKDFLECVFDEKDKPIVPTFDVIFHGKLSVPYKLLIEVLKHNYDDFLEGWSLDLPIK